MWTGKCPPHYFLTFLSTGKREMESREVFFFVVVVFCLVETTRVCIREVFGRGVRVSLQVQCP